MDGSRIRAGCDTVSLTVPSEIQNWGRLAKSKMLDDFGEAAAAAIIKAQETQSVSPYPTCEDEGSFMNTTFAGLCPKRKKCDAKNVMSGERAGSFGAESFYRGETALVSHNLGRKILLSVQFQSSRRYRDNGQ